MRNEVTQVSEKFLDTVYRSGDAKSALPLTCGYMKHSMYLFMSISPDEYKSDAEITLGEPDIIPTPEEMPSATVKMTEKVEGEDQSAFLTLYQEDGQWRVCDQTEKNRSEARL